MKEKSAFITIIGRPNVGKSSLMNQVLSQWKLLESDTYIINLNTVFTYNTLNNKFPIFKNSLKYTLYGLFNDNTF